MIETVISLEDLMRRAQGGDQRAYAEALQAITALVRPALRKWLRNSVESDDLLQEILISVHKSRHTYDGQRPFKPWLFAIARFRLSEHWRRVYSDKLRQAGELTEAENVPQPAVTNSGDAYEHLSAGLKDLPAKQAEIVRLIHIDGFTAKEAAQRLSMNESAVKVAAHRAYKVLKKRFEAE